MARVTVVCCAEISDPEWRWIEPYFSGSDVKFEFARCPPRKPLGAFLNLSRLLGALQAVRMAEQRKAMLIVTHGPTLGAWCALLAWIFGLKIPIVAHSFNFTSLPSLAKRLVFRIALRRVDRFVVFSHLEREIYSMVFDIPTERFDFVHWGVRAPDVENPDQAVEAEGYVAAIGGNARDYRTLIEAAWRSPEMRFVLVVRPENLAGMKIPSNVSVHANISFAKAMNILFHSRFMVLPLIAGDAACGHVTLVAAMHLGKAIVATDSAGISDYVQDRENAIIVDPGSAQTLAEAVSTLWRDTDLCSRLGENGRSFARSRCTEAEIAKHFATYLSIDLRGSRKVT
jgi:glycosyltransferase involved in cell wall biosynthesis